MKGFFWFFQWALIAIGSCAFANSYQQTWVFKNDPREIAQFLQSIDIDEDLFYQTLQDYRIQVLHATPYEPFLFEESQVKALPSDAVQAHLIWEDEWTQVYMPKQPRVPHHLWIVLNKEKHSFLEVSNEEALHLQTTLKKVIGILNNEFGYSQYVIAQFNQAQKDFFSDKVTIELIPTRPDAKEVLDCEDKIACNSYCAIRGEAPSRFMVLSDQEIDSLFTRWKEAMQTASFSLPPLPDVKRISYKNRNKKFVYLLDELFMALTKRGIGIERQIHEQGIPHTEDDLVIKEINNQCVFCNPLILSKQTMFEKDGVTVLLNHMPFVKGAHFLLIPSAHRPHFTDLTSAEILSMHEMTKMAIHALKERYGRSDIKMYIQEGFAAGQTVYHLHLHVFLSPDPIRHLFFGLSYDILPKVTQQEFDRVREEMTPLLRGCID